ncbi:MAG: MmcQ/YjbR family DNA-binding protein [Clostridiales bacterium]|jgi:predicted DNA-binding protein (MmcQ/YjbR family)|nr:MmcQ/YjbR family DNA-binding protein [Clostridiales bacterium]
MDKRCLLDYCLALGAAYEDYPFRDDQGWALMRHTANQRTFACVYAHKGRLCLNLKCEPPLSDFLRRQYADLTPGYHMNKAHWNTIAIGGDVPEDEIFRLIGHSYELTKPTKKAGKTT